jgi:hypothetical protein
MAQIGLKNRTKDGMPPTDQHRHKDFTEIFFALCFSEEINDDSPVSSAR